MVWTLLSICSGVYAIKVYIVWIRALSFADVQRVGVLRFIYIAESVHLYPSSLCILRFLLLIMSSVLPGVDVSCTYLCSLVSSSFISSSVSGCWVGGDGDCFFSDCVSESVDCLRFPAIFINGIAVVVLDVFDPVFDGTAVMSVC